MRAAEQTNEWSHECALLEVLYKQTEQLRGKRVYQDFYQVVRRLLQDGLYGQWITSYSAKEIEWLGLQIVAERDQLLSSLQLQQYMNEFTTSNHHNQRIGLPQERLMLIAMAAMQDESVQRLQSVKEAYWVLSKGYVTLPEDIMSFFGKTFLQPQANVQKFSMNVLDSGLPLFLSSKVKEKHIIIPDSFMQQVNVCGSWQVFETEQLQELVNGSHRVTANEAYNQVAERSLVEYKRVSAIGLMKQLLASKGVVIHFDRNSYVETSRSSVCIQLSQVAQESDLLRVCTILVRLLNGIEVIVNNKFQIKVAGWEAAIANQHIALHSDSALEYIEKTSDEINEYLETASRRIGIQIPLRKAAAGINSSAHPITKQQQSAMIDRIIAEQNYTDQGGSLTLERSNFIEMAELLQLLMKAWSSGIPEVRLI